MAESTRNRLASRSPAKINLTLEVLGRRTDGFHELDSIVTPVSLYDDLVFEHRANGELVIDCDIPEVPVDERNIVWQVAERLRGYCPDDQKPGMRCRLNKRIPAGGGLGGGSSNAAAALKSLNQLWNLNLSAGYLLEMAASVGSDVPLFLQEGPVRMTGRGEHVKPVELNWDGWIVLLLPGLAVSTARVYGKFAESSPSIRTSQRDLADQSDADSLMLATFNMLEPAAFALCPELESLAGATSELAGRVVRMSGSGSTLFTAFDDREEAETFRRRIAEGFRIKTELVRPIPAGGQ